MHSKKYYLIQFGTRNFVFYNGGESYWYGGYKGSGDGATLSTTFVSPSASPANFTFQLRQDAGAEMNFNGFNQFRLYDRTNNRLLATADVTESSSGTSSGTASSPKTSNGVLAQGASAMATVGGVLFGLFA